MKSILLVGAGQFGMHLARKLYDLGHEIMAVDTKEERVDSVLPYAASAQIGDASSYDFLETLGVSDFDVCFVTIGDDFQDSLETTSLLKELGAKMVVARASMMFMQSFCSETEQIKLFIPKSKRRIGQRLNAAQSMCLIIWSLAAILPFMRLKCRILGSAKP